AFKNLHFCNYNADNSIKIYDKKAQKITARYASAIEHFYRNECRWMDVLEVQVTGKYYKKNRIPLSHTATLYESLFFTKDTICNEVNKLDKSYLNPNGNVIERNKAQRKQLMFSPGRKISGIPFMGKSAAIFDKEITPYYEFSIKKEDKNGTTCYLFTATPKNG